MKKLHDWQIRFEAFISERRARPFVWGSNDCATFAADCIKAITGVDPAPTGLRQHRTEKQALRSLQRHGGLTGIATAAMGQPVPASQAGIGDVVLSKSGNRPMLSICNGSTVFAPGANGIISLALDTGSICWRVA